MSEAQDVQTLTAKFKSTCIVCGRAITPGTKINYQKDTGSWHATCEMPEIPPDAVHVSGGSGYGYDGWTSGEIIWNSKLNAGSTRDRAGKEIQSRLASLGNDPRYDHRLPSTEEREKAHTAWQAEREAILSEYPNDDGPEFLFVLTAKAEYFSEDGLSFGVGDESGYFFSAVCRPATDEESAPLRAQIEKSRIKREADARRSEIARLIQKTGTAPDKAAPDGVTITDRQDIYGGGDWFVVEEDRIWYVLNNGHDGDDWSQNNVRTGGAGAIGWYVPATPELLTTLDEIERILDPEAIERRRTDVGAAAYQQHFAGRVNDAIWGPTFEKPVAVPRIAFSVLVEAETQEVFDEYTNRHLTRTVRPAILAGADEQGDVYLATNVGDAYERYDVMSYLGGNYAIALRYPATAERLAEIHSRRPAWCTKELLDADEAAKQAKADAMKLHEKWRAEHPEPIFRADFTPKERQAWSEANRLHDHDSMESFKAAERAGAEAAEAIWQKVELAQGRFRLGDRADRFRAQIAADARHALHLARLDNVPMEKIEFTPDVYIRHAHAEKSPGSGGAWQLWSDGRITIGKCLHSGSPRELTDDASMLVSLAVRMIHKGDWTKADVETLYNVESVTRREIESSSGSNENKKLEELLVTHRGGETSPLYQVTIEWWYMGADGDAGTDLYLYRDQATARRQFKGKDQAQLLEELRSTEEYADAD